MQVPEPAGRARGARGAVEIRAVDAERVQLVDPLARAAVQVRKLAEARVGKLHGQGEKRAYLYGADEKMLGGLNSFFLLVDRPEVYHLPPDPQLPTRRVRSSGWTSVLGALVVGVAGLVSFRTRGRRE